MNTIWIDTHCHLDSAKFFSQAGKVAAAAGASEVRMVVIPAVERGNFAEVAQHAHAHENCCYALGIHPICVSRAHEDDLALLREEVARAMDDPRFVAIGEIGLDFFIPLLTEPVMRDKQVHFHAEHLKIARDFDLPVLLHVCCSHEQILKHLHRIAVHSGISYAFNGSFQQAQIFIDMGFKLGFGGAMNFTRALQIRRLASELPLESIVLETDAPNILPAWLHLQRNSAEELPCIGEVMAELHGLLPDEIARITNVNACNILPRLDLLL